MISLLTDSSNQLKLILIRLYKFHYVYVEFESSFNFYGSRLSFMIELISFDLYQFDL